MTEAISTAVGAKFRPITMIIGPVTIVGKVIRLPLNLLI